MQPVKDNLGKTNDRKQKAPENLLVKYQYVFTMGNVLLQKHMANQNINFLL